MLDDFGYPMYNEGKDLESHLGNGLILKDPNNPNAWIVSDKNVVNVENHI